MSRRGDDTMFRVFFMTIGPCAIACAVWIVFIAVGEIHQGQTLNPVVGLLCAPVIALCGGGMFFMGATI